MNVCSVCGKPAVGSVNVNMSAASSVPSRFEMRCQDHEDFPIHSVITHQPATTDGAGRLSGKEMSEVLRETFEQHPELTVKAFDQVIGESAAEITALRRQIAALRAGLLELADERDSYKSQADDLAFSCRQAEEALATAERERDDERSRIDWKTVAHRYRRAAREVGKSWLAACDDMGELLDRLQQAESELAASESRARALREALEGARHHLMTLNGLYATDRFDAYQDALENGCDSNGAYDALCDVVWVIDEKATIAMIDAALAAPATQPAAPTCKWCWTAVPSWGDVCASCEANMLRAHSDLAADDGPGAAPTASTFTPSGTERRDGYDPDQQLARRIDAWLDDLVLVGSLAASERRRLELKIGPGAAPSGESA